MPRYAAKVDKNQGEIVTALVDEGCAVLPLHAVGGGVPDLLWWKGIYGLIEVKDVTGKPKGYRHAKNALTPKQVEFHASWAGPIDICWTPEEAVEAVRRRTA